MPLACGDGHSDPEVSNTIIGCPTGTPMLVTLPLPSFLHTKHTRRLVRKRADPCERQETTVTCSTALEW
jgi:hypothetical protein